MLNSPNCCFFASIKFNEKPIVINKINNISNKNCENYYHGYNIHFASITFIITIFVVSTSYVSSIVSVHSSTSESGNFLLHLQFL